MTVTNTWTNWAGNQRAIAARVAHPASRDEVVAAVRAAAAEGLTVKAVGSGRSSAAVAATSGVRLEVTALPRTIHVDAAAGRVTVAGGVPLGQVAAALARRGMSVGIVADTDPHTVSGALATATNGPGGRPDSLPTLVTELELVTATGEVIRASADREPDIFAAARTGLGALGIITEVTLRCEPDRLLTIDEHLTRLDHAIAATDEYLAENQHVAYSWFPYTDIARVTTINPAPSGTGAAVGWSRRVSDRAGDLTRQLGWFGYRSACRVGKLRPSLIPGISRAHARRPLRTYTAASHQVFRTGHRPRFVAMEYAVPRGAVEEFLTGIRSIVEHLPARVPLPVDIRFTRGDDVWMSPSYGRDSAHVCVRQYVGMAYEEFFQRVEALAASHGGRPHWGKVHWRDATFLSSAYPRFADFLAIRDRLDPNRTFSNAYLERVLGP